MSVVLPPDFQATVIRAEAGDPASWGRLYGLAGAFMTGGVDLPQPLRAVIAARITDIGRHLSQRPLNDLRAGLANAVAPARRRVYGPKQAEQSRVEIAAQAALDMLAVDNRRGRRVAIVKQVAAIVGCEPSSVDRMMSTLSKPPKTG